MGSKYELVRKFNIKDFINGGIFLHRIRALKDFGDVKKGDIGGFVASENNLSQEGNCWIYDDAKVFHHARVYGDATIHDNACVYNDAKVYGKSRIHDNVHIHGFSEVFGNSELFGSSEVHGYTAVYNNIFEYNLL